MEKNNDNMYFKAEFVADGDKDSNSGGVHVHVDADCTEEFVLNVIAYILDSVSIDAKKTFLRTQFSELLSLIPNEPTSDTEKDSNNL